MNTFSKSNTKSFDKKNRYIEKYNMIQTNLDTEASGDRERMKCLRKKNAATNIHTNSHRQNNGKKSEKQKYTIDLVWFVKVNFALFIRLI